MAGYGQKKGFKHSQESKNKISIAHKGMKLTEETKKKISESKKGHICYKNPERGKKISFSRLGVKLSQEHRNNISLGHKGMIPWNKGKKGLQVAWNKGISPSKETREKMIKNKKKNPKETYEYLKNTPEWKIWRKKVFERDNYTCMECGKNKCELHPHHIKSRIKYPELMFDIDNGRTLCIDCHRKTDSYGCRAKAILKLI